MARFLWKTIAVLLLAVSVCTAADPQNNSADHSKARAQTSQATKRKVDGIANFGEVTPNLFRGGQPDHRGFEALKRMGVDIVVDTRSGRSDHSKESRQVESLRMKYVAIPWHCPFPHDEPFAKFLKLMRDNPDKRVFVHCRLGDDRTGMMVAAYRMASGWSAAEAMQEMKAFGFTGVHYVICPRLSGYEHSFPKRLETNPAFEGVRSVPAPVPGARN